MELLKISFIVLLIFVLFSLFGCTALNQLNPNLEKKETDIPTTSIKNIGKTLGSDISDAEAVMSCIDICKPNAVDSADYSGKTIACWCEK
ncbi:MAG: hypothetical protein WC308_00585 [archaeon]|jgi:hypothetical protein